MKLSDVKSKIDSYFDNIDAHELYELSIFKYGFTEFTSYTLGFKKLDVTYACESKSDFNNEFVISQTETLFLAA